MKPSHSNPEVASKDGSEIIDPMIPSSESSLRRTSGGPTPPPVPPSNVPGHWLSELAKVGSLLSASIALISLSLGQCESNKQAEKSVIRNWQQVAVYSIIEKSNSEGISFDELQIKYKTDIVDQNLLNMPDEEFKSMALKRVLLGLVEGRAIVALPRGKFRVFTDPMAPEEEKMREAWAIRNEISREILGVLRTKPQGVRGEDLEFQIASTLNSKATPLLTSEVISALLAGGYVVQKDGILILNSYDRSPGPPLQPLAPGAGVMAPKQ